MKELLLKLTALIDDAMSRQSDATMRLVQAASDAIARDDLDQTERLLDEAIAHDPARPEPYLARAKILTYLKGEPRSMVMELDEGLRLNRKIAEALGLDTLNLKILGNDFAGMGHLTLLDPIVKLKALGIIKKNHLMVVTPNAVANLAYLECWKKHLPVLVTNENNYSALTRLFPSIFEDMSMLEVDSGFMQLFEAWNLALNTWADKPPLLELTHEQKQAGEQLLESAGIPKGAWFVGLHVREGAKGGYLRSGANADVLDYLPAAQAIAARGGWVIRMGTEAKPLAGLPQLWDYANSGQQCDWMDVYLWASCRFFIGTSSGPASAPPTFGRPLLYTNACSIGHSPNLRHSLMIPKLLWSNKKKRLLTFREMLEGPYAWTVRPEFDRGETQLVENSPAEISAAVVEMLDRLEYPERYLQDTENQRRFNQIREPAKSTAQIRIADSFVGAHLDLLQ
jgi:putative glycosyltransferase (TIGR04372 family)